MWLLVKMRNEYSSREFLDILRNAPNLVDCGIDLVGEPQKYQGDPILFRKSGEGEVETQGVKCGEGGEKCGITGMCKSLDR
jgi:hypothetical protein